MRYEPGEHPELDGIAGVNLATDAAISQRPQVETIRRAYILFRRTLENIQYSGDDTRPAEKLSAAIREWLDDFPPLPDGDDTYELSGIMDDVRHLDASSYDRDEQAECKMPLATLVRLVHLKTLATFTPEGNTNSAKTAPELFEMWREYEQAASWASVAPEDERARAIGKKHHLAIRLRRALETAANRQTARQS